MAFPDHASYPRGIIMRMIRGLSRPWTAAAVTLLVAAAGTIAVNAYAAAGNPNWGQALPGHALALRPSECPGFGGSFINAGPPVPPDSPSENRSLGRLITEPGCVQAIREGRTHI